jgi:membrane protein DedA with SNARE-associated domain
METIIFWISKYGYAGLYFLLMFGIIGFPVPDETLLTFAGFLIHRGDLNIVPTFLAAFLGSITGITFSYVIGRSFGLMILKRYGKYVHISEDKIEKAHQWFEKAGRWSLTIGYFIPGIRHLTALVAGSSKLEYSVFSLFAYLGGFIWTITFISIGYYVGENWRSALEEIESHIYIVTIISVLLIIVYLLIHFLILKRKKKES